jgi:VanZ family protein
MSLKTAGNEPPLFANIDKVAHFTFYFVFVVLWYNFLRFTNLSTAKLKNVVLVTSFFFGLLIELCQEFLTQTRHADVFDVIANGSGCLFGYFFITVFQKYISK